jgi:hypothetical protein
MIRRLSISLLVAMPFVVPVARSLAEQANVPSREEGIANCVQAKEIVVQCKDEMADFFAAMVPAERRACVRAKALKEIVEEGSGPLEPRRAKCGLDYDRGKQMGRVTAADLKAMQACDKESGCKARVACWTARRKPAN